MTDMGVAPGVVPIVPCIDIDQSAEFYGRLGFALVSEHGDYRMLEAPGGLRLHLRLAEPGWIDPMRNANGIYIYAEEIDALASAVPDFIIGTGTPCDMAWGMYEFAISDPNGMLVRIGRPSEDKRP